MKRFLSLVITALLLSAVISATSFAARKPPAIDPIALAKAQLSARQTFDQTVHITAKPALSGDGKTARLTGVGTASFDSGATVVRSAVTLNVIISNTADPAFQQCQEALSQKLLPVDMTGHGYFTLEMLNGTLNQATLTLDVVTACSAGGAPQ